MTILWEFDEKHPKQVSAYGIASWATLSRPSGTQFGQGCSHADTLVPEVSLSYSVQTFSALFSRRGTHFRDSPDFLCSPLG
jgi:hypothetical protein